MISAKTVAVVAMLALAGVAVAQEKVTFAIRALATDDYDRDGVTFNLKAERERLRTWLSIDGNNEKLKRQPLGVNLFNWLGTEQGGPLNPVLAWFPYRISPSPLNDEVWDFSNAMFSPAEQAVRMFTDAEWNGGVRPENAADFLIEFLPINMHDIHFTHNDVEQESISMTVDEYRIPAIGYRIRADRRGAYGDWTEGMIGKKAAFIVNGFVSTAPVFRGRIESQGQIAGGFTEEEAKTLVTSLRASVGVEIDDGNIAANVMINASPADPWIALAYAYRLLHNQDEQVRREAATSLGRFGAEAKQAVPQLTQALNDKSASVRYEAITAVGMIGPTAKDAIPALEKLTQHEDPQIAARAKAALRQVRGR